MGHTDGSGAIAHAASAGQELTGAAWLDTHFAACRPEYEAMLRSVGLQPGWRVLDAGSGSGSYLPLLAEIVGPAGAIAALDLAPDNVAIIERHVAELRPAAPVEARVGSVLALPFAADTFDAVWFSATSQYLTDDELSSVLAEFRRVVRPGGLVAVKDYDATLPRFLPAPLNLLTHFYEAMARGGITQYQGALRTPTLASWLRRAGLGNVWTRTTLVERHAPLAPPERQFWGDLMDYFAPLALRHALPAEDHALWARLSEAGERGHLLDDPDFLCSEAHVVAVGTVR